MNHRLFFSIFIETNKTSHVEYTFPLVNIFANKVNEDVL